MPPPSEQTPPSKRDRQNVYRVLRVLAAASALVLVAAYTVGVVLGGIPKERRIDAVHLITIVTVIVAGATLVWPALLSRIRVLELKGIRIELLQHLQERQLRQENELQDVRLLVPLLFPEPERKHLSNLARGTTKQYTGGKRLRDELRRLRAIGLIQVRGGHRVGDLRSEMTVDLGDYVELTELGRRWVRRLADLEAATLEVEERPEGRPAPSPRTEP